jgi:hypothetical protein
MGWSRRDETKRRGADEIPQDIDIAIGADEVNPSLNLIKGGGALLREKIVAQAIIPSLSDQNRWAQSRKPMDMIVQG